MTVSIQTIIQSALPPGPSGYSGYSGISGYSGYSGISGYSGYSGWSGISGYSGYSGISGYSGYSGISGYSGYSGISGYSGYSGISGFSGYSGISGYSGWSGISGFSGISGYSGYSGWSGRSGYSGWSGISGYSGSGVSGWSGYSGISGYSGWSGISGYSGPGFTGATQYGVLYASTVSSIATTPVGTSGYYLMSTGVAAPTWTSVLGGATITDDNTTNATRYLIWDDITSGSSTSVGVSSTKLYFNPSTGTLNATNFNSLSDITLKKDVSQISNALITLDSLNGVQFTWKDNGRKSYGVIAQDIEKILPELVETSEKGIKTVNYAALTGFLIQAIKELHAEIEILKNK